MAGLLQIAGGQTYSVISYRQVACGIMERA